MGLWSRRIAAVLTVALVAIAPVCPCPSTAAATPSGHECCAPETGIGAAPAGCCETAEAEIPALALAVPSLPAPALTAVPAAGFPALGAPVSTPRAAALPQTTHPVLRI